MRVNNLTGSSRPWHYHLQCYTILGVFNAISTLLTLTFYQILLTLLPFLNSIQAFPGVPMGFRCMMMSLPHFELGGYTFLKTINIFLFKYTWNYYSINKLVSVPNYSLDNRALAG